MLALTCHYGFMPSPTTPENPKQLIHKCGLKTEVKPLVEREASLQTETNNVLRFKRISTFIEQILIDTSHHCQQC